MGFFRDCPKIQIFIIPKLQESHTYIVAPSEWGETGSAPQRHHSSSSALPIQFQSSEKLLS